jgi:uncharacterized protein YhdP
VDLPYPAGKQADSALPASIEFRSGNADVQKTFSLASEGLNIKFEGDVSEDNRLIDHGVIRYGKWDSRPSEAGIHFQIASDKIDLDKWITKVVELSKLKPVAGESTQANDGKQPRDPDSTFVGRMRSLNVLGQETRMLGRPFEKIRINATTVGNQLWAGTIAGGRIQGTINADLADPVKEFSAKLSHLYWGASGAEKRAELKPPQSDLKANLYPAIDVQVDRFTFLDRHLGRLRFSGAPRSDHWALDEFIMEHPSFDLSAQGKWSNQKDTGSISQFNSKLSYRGVGDILNDYQFAGFIKNGKGSLDANLKWIGAPHEFDMRRLNGDFDFNVEDGELIKVDAGSGKLLGLLNFNTIFRRLTFDFSDLFSKGLKFDDMRFAGVLGDGNMLLQEGFIYSPSIFLQADGRVGLAEQDIDLDINVSPELGGNLTLVGAIANPTAGAVMFLSQRLFRSEQWGPTVQRYHVNGPWKNIQVEKAGSRAGGSDSSSADSFN